MTPGKFQKTASSPAIDARCESHIDGFRITGAIRKKDAVGLEIQDFLSRCVRGHDRDPAAPNESDREGCWS
jgi:hypothetical protein